MVSIVAANDLELHSVDTEQASNQADKLQEGDNDRYLLPHLLVALDDNLYDNHDYFVYKTFTHKSNKSD